MIDLIRKAIKETNTVIDENVLRAFIAVESGGRSFSESGKLIIQFEPAWFKKKAPFAPSGKWTLNKIERQSAEWKAFNDAFAKNPNAAMESTSIGLPQIMGFHWKILGFSSVGTMWDYFKVGELNQIKMLIRFLEVYDKRLFKAVQERDWHMIAYVYNGAGYAAQAHRLGIKPYNEQMKDHYTKLAGG